MTDRTARAGDGWILAGALLALYCLLGQQSLYKVDGHSLLWLSRAAETQHSYHTFYLPGLELLKTACAPLGLGLYETARLYSALSAAIGMLFVHAACRQMQLSRLGSNVATLLLGTSPVVVFFATVVEVQAPFWLFASLAWLGAARLLRASHWLATPMIGVCFGLAYLSHPTAALMIFMLPTLLALGARSLPDAAPFTLQRCAIDTAVAGAAMGVFIMTAPRVLGWLAGTESSSGSAWHMLTNYPGDDLLAPLRTLEIAAEEWLLPLLPASALALWALRDRGLRAAALLLIAGLIPHLFVAQLMLKGYSERGAYLMSAALPTTLLALEVLDQHRRLIVPAVLVSAALAFVQVERHDDPERPRAIAEGLAEVSGGQPFFLIAGHPYDVEAMLLYHEELQPHWLGATVQLPTEQLDAALRDLDQAITLCEDNGLAVLISRRALDGLRDAARTDQWLLSHDPELHVDGTGSAAQTILAQLDANHQMTPVRAAGFDGFQLQRR